MSSGSLNCRIERSCILISYSLLIAILSLTVLSSDVNVASAESFQIGVKPGDWIEYDLNWTDPPAPPYTVWIRREILAVNGSIITVETVQERSDGSFKNDTEKGDVVEDTVAGAMGIWLIPSGLQTGDLINITGFGVVSINGTDQRAYLGSEHTVVWCDFLRMGFDVIVFWDQETGVVLEMHTQHVTRSGTTQIADSNLWDSEPVDGEVDNNFFWLGILLFVIAIISITFFLLRRHVSSKRKKRSRS